MRRVDQIILRPLLTEKSTFAQDDNTYVFKVGIGSNKLEIKDAVERFFGVKVEKVRTLIVRGKVKRFGRHHGRRSDWKKAYVTLAEGDNINFYAEEGEA